MKISELVKAAYSNSKEKGFHDPELSPLEYLALIHSEISEAVEAARDNTPPIYQASFETGERITPDSPQWSVHQKPEGELTELADAVIRIADYCGSRGWDLEKAIVLKNSFNRTRSYKHGGKKY